MVTFTRKRVQNVMATACNSPKSAISPMHIVDLQSSVAIPDSKSDNTSPNMMLAATEAPQTANQQFSPSTIKKPSVSGRTIKERSNSTRRPMPLQEGSEEESLHAKTPKKTFVQQKKLIDHLQRDDSSFFVLVYFPDGSHATVTVKDNQTISSMLSRLLIRRGISVNQCHVISDGS